MVKNVLGLLDFSEVTENVVKQSGELAGVYGAKCWLIHVAAPDPEFVGYDVGPQYVRDARAEALREEHQTLAKYKEQLKGQGVNCDALLIQGHVNESILAEIAKLNIDMVVVGSHGRSGLYEILIGSVTQFMLKNASIPVLIVSSKD